MARGDLRRIGIWGSNGFNNDVGLMFSMKPGMLTSLWQHTQYNQIEDYLRQFPDGRVHIRFMHPQNWWQNETESARNFATEILDKLPVIDGWGASWVCWNELNLPIENGWDNSQLEYCESPEFYERVANWTYQVLDRVKQVRPDTYAVFPPYAMGHKEDGAPIGGVPQIGWAGYDYAADMIKSHCNNEIAMHLYTGDGGGFRPEFLYGEEADWHAFRWKRVLELFAVRYNNPDLKIVIDEHGNFEVNYPTYPDDLIYYAEETLKNPHITGISIFLWDDPTHANDINNLHMRNDLAGLVNRLAAAPDVKTEKPNGGDSMYWKDFEERAIAHYAETGKYLNEAEGYKIEVSRTPIEAGKKKMRVVGIHHLTCEENHGMHNIFADVLDELGNRMMTYVIEYTRADGSKIYSTIDKPMTEEGTNAPLFANDVISAKVLSVDNEYPSDIVANVHTSHPDECVGNSLFHHSFFVVWQLLPDEEEPTPPPPPAPSGALCKFLYLVRDLFSFLIDKNCKKEVQ